MGKGGVGWKNFVHEQKRRKAQGCSFLSVAIILMSLLLSFNVGNLVLFLNENDHFHWHWSFVFYSNTRCC